MTIPLLFAVLKKNSSGQRWSAISSPHSLLCILFPGSPLKHDSSYGFSLFFSEILEPCSFLIFQQPDFVLWRQRWWLWWCTIIYYSTYHSTNTAQALHNPIHAPFFFRAIIVPNAPHFHYSTTLMYTQQNTPVGRLHGKWSVSRSCLLPGSLSSLAESKLQQQEIDRRRDKGRECTFRGYKY